MEIFPARLRRLWSKDELRATILMSLFLQIYLILMGSRRKRSRAGGLSVTLWLAYLLADGTAVFALGVLSNMQGDSDAEDKNKPPPPNNALLGFWAPFLLLHLGGQDSVTAYSLEDNELSRRHLLSLISQIIVAIYAFVRSLSSRSLLAPTCLLFLAGIIKYGERTWALRYASKEQFRDTMLARPNRSRNYMQLLENYDAYTTAGVPAKIDIEKVDTGTELPLDSTQEYISDKKILEEAYRFFQTFKRLIVDLMLTSDERRQSQTFFLKRKAEHAFKVIEIELCFFYTELYTKAAILYTKNGCICRLTTFVSILATLYLFLFATSKHGYVEADICITYMLLSGALIIEIYSFTFMFLSDATMALLLRFGYNKLWHIVHAIFISSHPKNATRWSNTMGQYNMINYCVGEQTDTKSRKMMRLIKVKGMWERYYYRSYPSVPMKLKDFIFTEIRDKLISCRDPTAYKRLYASRGEWALSKRGYRGQLGWSVETEFDESILIWHIATDLCFYKDKDCPELTSISHDQEMSRYISNYMLFLLVQLPELLTAGIGEIRFEDTCDEIKYYIRESGSIKEEAQVAEMLLNSHTKLNPAVVRGDGNKSVLFNGVKLASELRKIGEANERWKIISILWLEILSYAASHCRGYDHAQRLSFGGELLTHVWLLMAHLGIAEQYRIEVSSAKAKLVVEI